MSEDTAPWPPSEVAAQRINVLRKRASMNREQLAARCRKLGAPDTLTAAAVTNIETGRKDATGRRRRDLSVDELPIFAAALGVPPILLVVPLGTVELTEVLPGRVVSSWDALQWFAGLDALPTRRGPGDVFVSYSDGAAWETGAAAIDYYRQQEDLFRQRARASAKQDYDAVDQLDRNIDALRRAMRRAGIHTSELTADLAHVDTEEGEARGSTTDQAGAGR